MADLHLIPENCQRCEDEESITAKAVIPPHPASVSYTHLDVYKRQSLEEVPPAKQQIVCSRRFGERITDKDAMHQAVVQYAERAAEKLRGERQYCRQVTTFVRTSP